jgi:hypothetical protein
MNLSLNEGCSESSTFFCKMALILQYVFPLSTKTRVLYFKHVLTIFLIIKTLILITYFVTVILLFTVTFTLYEQWDCLLWTNRNKGLNCLFIVQNSQIQKLTACQTNMQEVSP